MRTFLLGLTAFASLALFASFVTLLWYIIRILMSFSSNR